jgi:hypothetical protein
MKLAFGGLIALILLGLYAYAVRVGVATAICAATTGCTALTAAGFTAGFASTMNTVGGLVSALVIAELAITRPGDAPMARSLAEDSTPGARSALKLVTGLYLLTWVLIGLWAYLVGVMWYPSVVAQLTDVGQAWLGLAVAAAYAYFGIKPA